MKNRPLTKQEPLASAASNFICLHPSFLFVRFQNGLSLCNLGCPGAQPVDYASLRLLPATASKRLGLKACRHQAQLHPLNKLCLHLGLPFKQEGNTVSIFVNLVF